MRRSAGANIILSLKIRNSRSGGQSGLGSYSALATPPWTIATITKSAGRHVDRINAKVDGDDAPIATIFTSRWKWNWKCRFVQVRSYRRNVGAGLGRQR